MASREVAERIEEERLQSFGRRRSREAKAKVTGQGMAQWLRAVGSRPARTPASPLHPERKQKGERLQSLGRRRSRRSKAEVPLGYLADSEVRPRS